MKFVRRQFIVYIEYGHWDVFLFSFLVSSYLLTLIIFLDITHECEVMRFDIMFQDQLCRTLSVSYVEWMRRFKDLLFSFESAQCNHR